MKRILPYLFVGLASCFNACDSSKKSAENKGAAAKEANKSGALADVQVLENGSSLGPGIVTNKYRDESCSFLIIGSKNGEELILHPANLTDEFKKEGLKVQVKYRLTRQPNTDGCSKGLFVQIEEIKAL